MPTDQQVDQQVYVIDDDDAVRDSLEFLLKSAGLAVESYESAQEFLKQLSRVRLGCIITDVRMPGITGIDLLRKVKEVHPQFPVIVLTGHGDIALAVEAMKLGASDFFEKPYDDEALLTALQKACARQLDSRKSDEAKAEVLHALETLTPRERDVLLGLVSGRQNKVIAANLGISPRTVEIYRANLMSKMGAASLSDLVRMALTAGIQEKD